MSKRKKHGTDSPLQASGKTSDRMSRAELRRMVESSGLKECEQAGVSVSGLLARTAELEGELAKSRAELEEYKRLSQAEAESMKQRLQKKLEENQADLEGFKQRSMKERADLVKYSGEKVFKELLELADNFDRALGSAESCDKEALVNGVGMIREQLAKLLAAHEVTEIRCEGEKFDPNQHEAMTVCPAPGKENGTVLQVYQAGYRFKDHVLRAPKVVVVENPEE